MRLLESLRRLVKPKLVCSAPIEVSAALIDDLYSALKSLAIGAITGVLVGGIAASRTGSAWLNFLTVAAAYSFSTYSYIFYGSLMPKS